jgi:hypothetical protein
MPSKCVPSWAVWNTRTKYVPGGKTPTGIVYGPHDVITIMHVGLRSDEMIVIVVLLMLTLKGGLGLQLSLQVPEI